MEQYLPKFYIVSCFVLYYSIILILLILIANFYKYTNRLINNKSFAIASSQNSYYTNIDKITVFWQIYKNLKILTHTYLKYWLLTIYIFTFK